MSDFDPDAHLDSTSASGCFDPDAHLDSPQAQAPYTPPPKDPSLLERYIGFQEGQLHGASGIAGSLAGGLTYLGKLALSGGDTKAAKQAQEAVSKKLTYDPLTDVGKQSALNMDEAGQYLGAKEGEWSGEHATDLASQLGASPQVAGGIGAAVNTAVQAVPYLLGGAAGRKGGAAAPVSAEEALTKSFQDSPQSMGASAAAPDISRASPELKQAIADAAQSGQPLNADVLNRKLRADALPVKINLTEGQATRDPTLFSREQNDRARQPLLAAHFNDQGDKLVQNLDAIRENVGPDVFTNNPVDHAETVIGGYKEKAAAADAVTSSKYKALKDANGGEFPVDAQTLVDNASAKLHKELLFDHAPKAIMSTLNRLADSGKMTFENFESMRTNLARIQRSLSADGNEKAAASIIRQTMEDLPLSPGSAKLKPLADAARASAKAQFDALDADPAYKAAVNDSISADKFAQKHIIGASRDDAKIMRENLQHDPQALQAMGVTVVDHLRNAAGIDHNGNGAFGQSRYNKQLNALRPKLDSLLDSEHIDQLQSLGDTARDIKEFPAGHSVNTSNTFTAAAGDHAANALEGVVNVAAKGLPVGTVGRKLLQGRAAKKAAEASLGQGAGLTYRPTRLSDLAKKRTSP